MAGGGWLVARMMALNSMFHGAAEIANLKSAIFH
jgi:hypothetical protein